MPIVRRYRVPVEIAEICDRIYELLEQGNMHQAEVDKLNAELVRLRCKTYSQVDVDLSRRVETTVDNLTIPRKRKRHATKKEPEPEPIAIQQTETYWYQSESNRIRKEKS